MRRKEKTTITADRADFDEAIRREFDFVSQRYQIPRGKLLSRGLYLALNEIFGEKIATNSIEVRREFLHKTQGLTFNDDILLDSESWRELIPGMGKNLE